VQTCALPIGLFALDALVVAALSQDGCVTEVDDGRCLIMCFFHGFSFRGAGTTIEINRTMLRRRFPLIHPRVLAEKRERINANKVNMTSGPVVEAVCHPRSEEHTSELQPRSDLVWRV